LFDQEKLNRYIKELEPDIIFHLAGYVNPNRDLAYLNKMIDINLKATVNLLNSLNDLDYYLFINTGTSEEYGNNQAPFHERQKLNPVSPYSASKAAATIFCNMIKTIYNKPIITVRPFLVYGGKQISKMLIPSLIFSSLENKEIKLTAGEQSRDFIYVKDVAAAFLVLSENRDKIIRENVFNIGTGKEFTIKKIVEILKEEIKTDKLILGALEYRKGENFHYFSSIQKIKEYTGWQPKYSIKEGLHETVEWCKKNKKIWRHYINIYEKFLDEYSNQSKAKKYPQTS